MFSYNFRQIVSPYNSVTETYLFLHNVIDEQTSELFLLPVGKNFAVLHATLTDAIYLGYAYPLNICSFFLCFNTIMIMLLCKAENSLQSHPNYIQAHFFLKTRAMQPTLSEAKYRLALFLCGSGNSISILQCIKIRFLLCVPFSS